MLLCRAYIVDSAAQRIAYRKFFPNFSRLNQVSTQLGEPLVEAKPAPVIDSISSAGN